MSEARPSLIPVRPYSLVVDSGSPNEPDPRLLGSLATVWEAYDALDPEWKPFAEVRCASANGRGGVYWPKIDRQGRVQP